MGASESTARTGSREQHLTKLGRTTLVFFAALACGWIAASLGWLVVLLLEAGRHRVMPVHELFLMALTSAGPMGAVFALPGALVAPLVVRRARLWPTLPVTFTTAVLVTAAATLVTGTFGLIVLAPVAGYVAGFLALALCVRAYPLRPVSKP